MRLLNPVTIGHHRQIPALQARPDRARGRNTSGRSSKSKMAFAMPEYQATGLALQGR
jgi:hypothetical protein